MQEIATVGSKVDLNIKVPVEVVNPEEENPTKGSSKAFKKDSSRV